MNKVKKKVKIKDVIKYLLMLALAVVLLYFAFRDISWNDFMEGLRSCNYWWILLSMIISWIVVVLRGWRWRLMMRPLSKEITRLEAYDAYNICYLANLVLPRSGEVVRCGMIANSGKAVTTMASAALRRPISSHQSAAINNNPIASNGIPVK